MTIPFLSLLKKPLDTVSEEMTSKFRTPFFTTYAFVWVISNNMFVYNLFFNSSISDKSRILENQLNLNELSFYLESFLTIGISLITLVVFYLILNISRSISMLSEERIKLNILKKLKSKTIGSIDEVKFWKSKADDLTIKNRHLEDDISSSRSSLNYVEDKLENKENQLNKNKELCNNTINEVKTLLEKNLYTHNRLAKDESFKSEIDAIKRSFDNVFIRYENAKKPLTLMAG
ncbi:MAG: hypothetical protein COB01_04075 [Lutibacter sp.]|nr:MAG: hypothetical protein COB01_04075 [Lutibacter sp.]